jgi:macrolide transport system ATP-binding/permease protein
MQPATGLRPSPQPSRALRTGIDMQPSQFTLRSVGKRFTDRVVFESLDLVIRPGEKVGIVGDNGAGKSTLLRILAGAEPVDNGERTVVADGGIGYLPQTLDLPHDATVGDAIDLALHELRLLEARMHDLERQLSAGEADATPRLLEQYGEAAARFESRSGYDADARVDIHLHHLGLPALDRSRSIGTLSGGERARLHLAATLAGSPELLLLDEPTNDLDDAAVFWLEDHLRKHRGTLLAATHDRVFLDRLTSVVLDVEDRGVARYGDGYEGYLRAKAAQRRRRLFEYEQWRLELGRNERLVASNATRLDAIPRRMEKAGMGIGQFRMRGRDHGAKARIRNAKERLTRLNDAPVAAPADPLVFAPDLHGGTPAAHPVVDIPRLRVGTRLDIRGLRLEPGERLLVTGPNGAGKSTLMRAIAGELHPDDGEVETHGRIGFLHQDGGVWPPASSLLEAFAEGRPGFAEDYAEELLALGLFRVDDLDRPVADLSYGQQRRLEIARLVSEPTDLLLLDEPTNHLTPALVEELEAALVDYPGAVVVVTHDRLMRRRFTGRHLQLADGLEVAADRLTGRQTPQVPPFNW